jgi:3-oxoacyl-[acyl-carrier-protein] synthase-1
MMKHNFVAPSINIDNLDPHFDDSPVVRSTVEKDIKSMLSLNFGFGGTNSAVVLSKLS